MPIKEKLQFINRQLTFVENSLDDFRTSQNGTSSAVETIEEVLILLNQISTMLTAVIMEAHLSDG